MKQKNSKKQRHVWLCAMIAGTLFWQAQGPAFAAEADEYEFDQMVVTATKTPVKKSEANANISVITREKIEQQHYTDLEQALRDVPGVTILNYGRAGYNLSNGLRINGSPNVLVLIDGVRAGHADITFPASAYMALENVERIEVLKGSASAIYGSDAKGGVINIITRKPQGEKSSLNISGGSSSREDYSLSHEGVVEDWAYRITAKKRLLGDAEDGRGNTIPQSLNADALGFKVSKSFGQGSDLTLSYNSYKSDWMYYDAAYGGGITRGTSEDYDWNIVFNHEFDPSAHNTFTFKNSHFDYVAPTWERDIQTMNITDQFTKKINDRHTVIAGFDYTRDKVLSSDGIVLNNRAAYIQSEWDMTNKWKLTSGLRYDNNSAAGSSTTPRFNLGFKADDKTNYYISYSEFFVTPTTYQLFNSVYGNRDLKPEDGHTTEIGVDHRFSDSFTASANVFRRKTDNAIGFNYSTWKYYNLNDEDTAGWDVQLNKRFSDKFTVSAGYTYTNMKEQNGTLVNANGYIPKHAINVGVDYTVDKFDIGLQGRAAIDRKGKTTVSDYFPCDSYWIWDIGVNYKVNKDTKAFVKVNNIFDKFYAEQSAASSSTPGNWYAMPGRSVILGMEYLF